ncbi:hypothetical protein HY251_17255, partial [bacterium]|nr:hypothetical protein [bacterium]
MESLTQDQLAYLRRHGNTKNPKTLARDLELEVPQVQDALRAIRSRPAHAPRIALPMLAWAFAIILLGAIAYWNNRACEWHFDDFPTIVHNEAVQHPTVVGIYKYNIYRQVLYWSFAISYKWHKTAVLGWHIENNAIHLLNALLVSAFTLLTLSTPTGRRQARWPSLVAGLAGLIFVVHPLQTQAVTYITQRTESLCATFYLVALSLYALARVRRLSGRASGDLAASALPLAGAVGLVVLSAVIFGRPVGGLLKPFLAIAGIAVVGGAAALVALVQRGRADALEASLLGGSLLAAFLCMETKEIGGTLPYTAVLWEVLFARPEGAGEKPLASLLERLKAHVAAAPWAAIGILLPLLAVRVGLDARFLMKEGLDEGSNVQPITGGEYFLTELNVLATYVRLSFFPWHQALDYDYPKASSLFSGPTFLSLLALSVAVTAAVRGFRRAPVLTWAVAFGLAILAPTSSFFVLPDFIFEHRAYLPLAGGAFLAAVVLERFARKLSTRDEAAKTIVLGAAIPLVLVFVFLTRERNEAWQDEGTLWRDSSRNAPGKPRPLTNLGLYYENNEPYKLVFRDGELGGNVIDGAEIGRPDLYVVIPT